MDINWDQYKAAGRHVASYVAGGVTAAVALHMLSPSQGADLQTDVNQIVSGLQSVATGVAGIVAVLTPIYTAWRAAHSASPQAQKATVAAMPNTIVVTSDRLTATADNIASMPSVKQVLSTPEIAKATASDKVVAP